MEILDEYIVCCALCKQVKFKRMIGWFHHSTFMCWARPKSEGGLGVLELEVKNGRKDLCN